MKELEILQEKTTKQHEQILEKEKQNEDVIKVEGIAAMLGHNE